MNEFEFPTNIRQIGSIGDGLRIYIEDYAYTYLKHHAEAGGYEERIALLIGRQMIIDGNRVLFISGAIQGIYTQHENGMPVFSEQSMNYAYDKMQLYFRGLEIVGWMLSQPSYGVMLNSSCVSYHAGTFLKPDQVLFVSDHVEDLNAFYIWNAEKEELEETCGYFIYYDKNRGMQEYMLENRVREKPAAQSAFRLLAKSSEQPEREPDEPLMPPPLLSRPAKPLVRSVSSRKKSKSTEKPVVPVSFIKPKIAGSDPPHQERRITNLLVSLSAVLVLVCFIMGAGLIQNEGRITNLEDQLLLLTTSFRDLAVSTEGRLEAVFAQSRPAETPADWERIAVEAPVQQMPVPVLVSPTPTPETAQPMPTPAPAPTPAATVVIPETYTVAAGDSLLYISWRFYGTSDMVPQIMEINGLQNADMLYVGTTLHLPRLENY